VGKRVGVSRKVVHMFVLMVVMEIVQLRNWNFQIFLNINAKKEIEKEEKISKKINNQSKLAHIIECAKWAELII
jgi:hypothetical protein